MGITLQNVKQGIRLLSELKSQMGFKSLINK